MMLLLIFYESVLSWAQPGHPSGVTESQNNECDRPQPVFYQQHLTALGNELIEHRVYSAGLCCCNGGWSVCECILAGTEQFKSISKHTEGGEN